MFYKIYQVSDYIKELQIKNATQAKNIGISSNQLNNGDIVTNNTRNIPNTNLKGNNSEIATKYIVIDRNRCTDRKIKEDKRNVDG